MSGLLYTIGWLLLVMGGASGSTFWPLMFACAAVFWQLLRQSGESYYRDLFTLLYISLLGMIIEAVNVRAGLLRYQGTEGVPLWILALYPLFGITLNHTLSFLKRSKLLAAILGAFGGIASYRCGAALGAVEILTPAAWIVLGAVWALLLPLLIELIARVDVLIADALTHRSKVRMLYDGDCPLCSREAKFLQKRNEAGLVAFVNIAKRDSYEGIPHAEMMSEMLVLDHAGNIYRGIDAFFELYGRLNLVPLALYLKAPLFYPLNRLAYSLFARFRPFLSDK